MNASILTTLGGFPTVVVAIFQAQSGWSIDFASGHAAVAHWMRPRAFSMSFECIACPSTMVCKTSITRMCLLAAMRTCGMFESSVSMSGPPDCPRPRPKVSPANACWPAFSLRDWRLLSPGVLGEGSLDRLGGVVPASAPPGRVPLGKGWPLRDPASSAPGTG